MSIEYLFKLQADRQKNGERSAIEENEEVISFALDEAERGFVSRYPDVCQIFDDGFHEFLASRGLFPERLDWRADGVPAGVGFLVARQIARRAVRLVQKAKRSAIISSGVYGFAEFEKIKDKIDTVKKNGVCRIILVSVHGQHVHVLHDCPLSHGTCKCFGFVPKRSSTRRNFIGESSKASLAKIIFYYFNSGKWIYYFKIGEERYTSKLSAASQADRLAASTGEGLRNEGTLESCDNEDGLLLESGDERDSEGSIYSSGPHKKPRIQRDKKRSQTQADLIYGKLRQLMCSPLKDFSRTSDWFDDDFLRNLKTTHQDVGIAFNRLTYELSSKSLGEYGKLYNVNKEIHDDDDKYLFGCLTRKNYWNHYYTKMESLVWLKKLLIWQYAPKSINSNGYVSDKDWKTDVYAFVKYLMTLLDQKMGKKNTLYIQSAPNAGKTLFCDCIADYFVSVGHLKVWNRSNSFPLEELDGARIAFWNEPNFESGNVSEMLKLLGGDNLSVAIKYNRPSTIQNVPVIVTSNRMLFPTTPEFQERISYHYWRPCDILIDVGKKRLHPYSLDLLFTECENYYEEKIR